MLAPSGDRAVPALFDLLYCYHNACPKWRQGGALFESLNCLIYFPIKLMVMAQEVVSAIRERMPRNLGSMSWTL